MAIVARPDCRRHVYATQAAWPRGRKLRKRTYRCPRDGATYVFVIDRDGAVEQYRLEPGETLHAKRVRSFRVGSQAEGIAADRETANVS